MLCSALASWRQPAVSCPAGESWPTGLSVRRAAPELVCRPVFVSRREYIARRRNLHLELADNTGGEAGREAITGHK